VITAVDTSVLLDVFTADPKFGPASASALRDCLEEGRLVVCEAVLAETATVFANADAGWAALEKLGVTFGPMTLAASLKAAVAWRSYRARGGTRQRIAADFLIGAHAKDSAERLLTRDRGFYRTYFRGLKILDPTSK
jgi:predicted nucleic acid-binding protein